MDKICYGPGGGGGVLDPCLAIGARSTAMGLRLFSFIENSIFLICSNGRSRENLQTSTFF